MYYSNDPSKAASDPSVPGSAIGNYSYVSCVADTGAPRLLDTVLVSDSMSNEACVAVAEAQQYVYAGTQYGRECWLGNQVMGNTTAVGNVKVKESECSVSCSGARTELCGGPSRVNLWVRNVTASSGGGVGAVMRVAVDSGAAGGGGGASSSQKLQTVVTVTSSGAASAVLCVPTGGATAVQSPWVCGSG